MKIKKLLLVAATLAMVSPLASCNLKRQIGILQPVEHAALGAAREGFIDGLKEAGFEDGKNIKIVYRNAGGNDADLNAYAKSLTSTCELTLGIGTGASAALKAAEDNAGLSNPLLFTAVTDPVEGGLLTNTQQPEGFVTGTSDAQPVAEQIALIKECIPAADKIGILYTVSEVNSQVQAEQATEAAERAGLSVEIETCTGTADIKTAATNLATKAGIDAIYIPTDNNIAANMNAVKTAADENHVLLVCGEEGIVKNGGHITFSFSYYQLGKKTGELAAQILNGEKTVKDIPVYSMGKEDCEYIISTNNLADAQITLPQSVLGKSREAE